MGSFLRYCFWMDREAFLDDLRPKYILPSLIKDCILAPSDREDILSEKTFKHQVSHLIDILVKKDSKAFDCFINALNEEDAYPWLADRLIEKKKRNKNDEDGIEAEEMHKQLAMGGIPFPTNYFFEREDKLYDIRSKLIHTADVKRRWIVLHGMLGSGKSVLAAEAVRDTYVFQQCFTSGICWIPIGNLRDKIENGILNKLQVLWERLEPNNPFLAENREVLFMNPVKEKVKKCLRTVFTEKANSKFLLILDDVWDEAVIKAFDVGCTIMVTTRNVSVVNSVVANCACINIEGHLTLQETKEFLARFVKAKADDLPAKEISIIHAKTKGLPLSLSLIGSMMLPYGNRLKRWSDLSQKIEKGISQALTRSRKKSGDLAQLKDMIELSIDSLDDETKDHYLDFAIFEEDVFIPNKVLEVLWDRDSIEVEDIMHELYQKSLISFEKHPESDSYSYSVHDLYLEYLKDKCRSNEDLVARHKKLIDHYLKLCKTDDNLPNYDCLPNDGYIYYYIGYHIYHSQLEDYFKEIFLDFNFIQNKLRYAGSSDLLYDFSFYRQYFHDVMKEMQDIEAFVRRNAHLLCTRDADIIQLALFEPIESTVYKNAQLSALLNSDKIYYEWSNQGNVPYLNILNTKLGFDDLRSAVFNPSNDIVATVGEDSSVMLWDSTTGKELDKLQGHLESINCCCFNSLGDCLATASADKTVRLWDISAAYLSNKRGSKTKRNSMNFSVLTDSLPKTSDPDSGLFTCHEAEVLWCSFSLDDKLIVSGDSLGVVYVWDCETKDVKWEFSHEDNSMQIMCCQISHSITHIATASGSTIKVWNLMEKVCEYNLMHNNDLVIQCCFSKDDEYIFSISASAAWMWSMSDGHYQKFFEDSQALTLCCCCLSPNEKFLASGTSNFSVIVWSTATLKQVANLKGHKNAVQSVTYSEDGSKLLSASADGHIIVWDMTYCMATSMVSLENNLSVKNFHELTICSSDHLNCIQVRSGFDGELKCKSSADPCDITSCSLSDDCSEVVYGTKSGSVKTFNLSSKTTVSHTPHAGQVGYLIHLDVSYCFISCSEDCTLRFWDEERNFGVLKGHIQPVVMCLVFGSGQKVLSCSEDGTLRVWSLETLEMLMVMEGHGNQKVTFCDVSPCELLLCSASADCTIKIWSAENGRELKTLICKDCVRCCRFSPVKGIIVSGEDSGEVKMWDISRSIPSSKSLGFHDSWVKAIKFSSDGSYVVSVSDSIKLWTKSGAIAQTIVLPGAFTCALWASPNFKMFVLVHNSVLYILKSVV